MAAAARAAESERDQPLLRAVVEVAFDPATSLVRGRHDPLERGSKLGPGLRVRDRGRDELGEVLEPVFGIERQGFPGPHAHGSPKPARHDDRARNY